MRNIFNITRLMSAPWRQLTEEEQTEAIRLARWAGQRQARARSGALDPNERALGPELRDDQQQRSPQAVKERDDRGASLDRAHTVQLPMAELLEAIDPRSSHYFVSRERERCRLQGRPAPSADRATREAALAAAKETELQRGRELYDRQTGRAGAATEAERIARYEAAMSETNQAQAFLAVVGDEAAWSAGPRHRRPPSPRRQTLPRRRTSPQRQKLTRHPHERRGRRA